MSLAEELQKLEFEGKITTSIRHYQLYEDRRNRLQAFKHLEQFSNEQNEEIRFLKLLEWFKESFFTWMDAPKCPTCAKPTQPLGHATPTQEEMLESAERVEAYTCSKCFPHEPNRVVARFPRYNNPVKLLETRAGRCGEWANCFALLCRALGYEVRHVSDWTDHVWVEIFLPKQGRWVHCDPCENAFDTPLLYESGWGKKLTYIIAVSHDDIQDVTWRYTHSKNHSEVISRRLLVPESWLVATIIKHRKLMQANLIPARKHVLQERLIKELVEFISPTKVTSGSELRGRISGSLEWRQARHETGKDPRIEGFVWDVGTGTQALGTQGGSYKYTLTYNCVQDSYNVGEKPHRGWQNGVFRSQDMFRKEERDWSMVYLARNPNNSLGSLSWKFSIDSAKPKLQFKKFVLSMETSSFHESATVTLELSTSSGHCIQIPKSSCQSGKWRWTFTEFEPSCSWIILSCRLEGGDGALAWQHAQLFRQSTLPKNSASGGEEDPLRIEITMNQVQD